MITLKIDKYEEPKPVHYPATVTVNYTQPQNTFSKTEIHEAQELALSCGIEEGMVLEHVPTSHIITIIGFNDASKILGYKGKPMIIKAKRKRQEYEWITIFSLDELLDKDYKVISPGVSAC